jgi:hypothetical protein
VQAFSTCDLLQLSISDLFKMKLEFPRIFNELFNNSRDQLRRDLMLKIEVIKQSQMIMGIKAEDPVDAMKSKFASNFLGGLLKKMTINSAAVLQKSIGTPTNN